MLQLGKISLPPAPKPARDLATYQHSVEAWARQVEQTIRQMERYLRALEAEVLRIPRS